MLGCLALLGAPLPPAWAPPQAQHLHQALANTSCPAALQQLGGVGGWSMPQALQRSALEGPGWLDVGAADGEPRLWWSEDGARREWMCRLLSLLASEGSCPAMHPVAAKEVRCVAACALLATRRRGGSLAAAREAAKGVLAVQRTNHALWCAYAELEATWGSAKVLGIDVHPLIRCLGVCTTMHYSLFLLCVVCYFVYRTHPQVARRVIDASLQSLQQGAEDPHEALLSTLQLCSLACRAGADAQHAQHVLAWLAQGAPTGDWPRLPPYVAM